MARYEEESCTVRFEEGLDDDCHYVVVCFAIPCENSVYHFVNTVGRTGHLGRCRTGHNRCLLYIGHRGIGHDGRSISFGCRCGGNRRHGDDNPVIVVARYPDYGIIDARSVLSMYFEARSGEPERLSCG